MVGNYDADHDAELWPRSDGVDWNTCTFERVRLFEGSDSSVAWKARANGKFVSADLSKGGKLIANADQIQQWEKFHLEDF